MQTLPRDVNPFALMLDPQAVIAQIERSERLEGLHRRVCRPLDKPLLGGSEAGDEAADGEPAAFDATADRADGPGSDGGLHPAADGAAAECLAAEPQRHD